MSNLRGIICYLIIVIPAIIIEILITGQIWWSFWISYIGLFFVARYVERGLDTLFTEFHVTTKIRNLIIPWVFAGIIAVYCYSIFLSGFFIVKYWAISNAISIIVLVFLIILTINPAIRLGAVAFHRRKTNLFPINRIEFAAMKYLKIKEENFSVLKNKLKGIFNIFIPNLYFEDETAASSIYHLCGLRYADISEGRVALNKEGEKQVKFWEESLEKQNNGFRKILNRRGILIRSFILLCFLSIIKIGIGLFNSESLMADGFENFLDVLAVVLIGIGIKYAKEKLVNIVLVGLMSLTGIMILYDSILVLLNPHPVSNFLIIIGICIVSILLNTYLRAIKNFVGKNSRNSSLVASAIDSRVNIFISLGVIIGALISNLGTIFGLPQLYYIDGIVALMIVMFIFKEVFEIIKEFIIEKEEEIDFESFQMNYERTFREYIIKWILTVLYKEYERKFAPDELNIYFQESLRKGEQIYSEFAHFGLYLFEDKGISFILDALIDEGLLIISEENIVKLTEKGNYVFEEFYSGRLLEDVQDPFDFFFEHDYDLRRLYDRKKEVLKNYEENFKK